MKSLLMQPKDPIPDAQDAKTLHLYIFSSKAFENAYSFIFFIFLACWYLYYLFDTIKDKLCLLKHLNLNS